MKNATYGRLRKLCVAVGCVGLLGLGGLGCEREASTPAPAPAVKKTEPLAADNTGVNKRDRDDKNPVATDQLENEPDIETTAAIRRAVMDLEGLSFTAQNIKIITANGVVTLRGPVESEAERMRIVEAAKRATTAKTITDNLEIAPPTDDD